MIKMTLKQEKSIKEFLIQVRYVGGDNLQLIRANAAALLLDIFGGIE